MMVDFAVIKARFSVKPQDCYYGIVDNYSADKMCVVNGLHTKIEAKWVCDFLNEQQERINELENINEDLSKFIDYAGLRAEFYKWLFSIKEVRVGE